MQNGQLFPGRRRTLERSSRSLLAGLPVSRRWVISLILTMALFAFEIFNFDTTRYALADLLGDANFAGVHWAVILAIAFCAIDFAGLAYLFSPAGEGDSGDAWYLMGAWLLGATMNAMMTWWAVNLTLLAHPLGNEVLSREQLLEVVPVFVAVLVWLTRILFIGAFSVAGEHVGQENAAYVAHEDSASMSESEAISGSSGPRVEPVPQSLDHTPTGPVPPQPVAMRTRSRSSY